MKNLNSIALVITAKNEERLLKHNLEYHFAVGVSKAFIYFDEPTDQGPDSINNLPDVIIQNSVEADQYKNKSYLDKFTSKAIEHHTARQCLNTYDAMQKCKELGIDWLISIDADELIIADEASPKSLNSIFQDVGKDVDLVHFDTKEAVQRKVHYSNVFAEECLFKYTHNFKRKIDKLYKKIEDPFLKKNVKISYWMGQFQGKSAIRVSSDLIPKNVHRYKKIDGSKINQIKKGLVLHYNMFDRKDFLKKFQNFKNRPNTFLGGNSVSYKKKLWRDLVNSDTLDRAYIDAYFENNILFSDKEIKSMSGMIFGLIPRKQPAFMEITSVNKVFKQNN